MSCEELSEAPKILEVLIFKPEEFNFEGLLKKENSAYNVDCDFSQGTQKPNEDSKQSELLVVEEVEESKNDLNPSTSRQMRNSTLEARRRFRKPDHKAKAYHSRTIPIVPDYCELGTMKFRLNVLGLAIDFDRPTQNMKWYRDFYKAFEGKYWKRKKRPYYKYFYYYYCLICSRRFCGHGSLIGHLNSHMGYHIMHCHKCDKKFYSFKYARLHLAKKHNFKSENYLF